MVVHTSVPFGLQHLEEDMTDVCNKLVLPRVLELVPELPPPEAVKPHKWRYSQVSVDAALNKVARLLPVVALFMATCIWKLGRCKSV